MNLTPRDRRGLGEIIAWSSTTVAMAIAVFGYLLRGIDPPQALVGALVAVAMLAVARGTDSAGQRSGSVELRNAESAELRAARDQFERGIARLELVIDRAFQCEIERRLPPPPLNLTTRSKKDDEK